MSPPKPMVRGTLARYMDSMLLPEPGDDAELTRRGTEIVARAAEPYQARLIGVLRDLRSL